ncbi:SCO family protein [Zhouia sp. PK063]|uniref:SCO family protein n=1 Tax=Zhouia sp. PK063 TaxID=3373602 RepID=UPI00378E5C7D
MKKTNYSYIGISLVILVFGIWAVPKIVNKFKKSDLVTIGKAPQFSLTDQNGKTITNKDYAGKVYVVEFFYTTCPSICPIMTDNMTKLQDKFYGNPNFGVASFSINPEYDTPQILKDYAKEHNITIPNWHLLTGNQDTIYDIANKGFGIYAGENDTIPGGFQHNGLFALIDQDGNIRSRKDDNGNPMIYYDGTEDSGVQMIKEDIQQLLNK